MAETSEHSRPLRVLIVGAGQLQPKETTLTCRLANTGFSGIGGLTAALGLRQQGHEVTVSSLGK